MWREEQQDQGKAFLLITHFLFSRQTTSTTMTTAMLMVARGLSAKGRLGCAPSRALSTEAKRVRIGVLGGGISGLSFAHFARRLAKNYQGRLPEVEVHVFEKERQFGGCMKSQGFRSEHSFSLTLSHARASRSSRSFFHSQVANDRQLSFLCLLSSLCAKMQTTPSSLISGLTASGSPQRQRMRV